MNGHTEEQGSSGRNTPNDPNWQQDSSHFPPMDNTANDVVYDPDDARDSEPSPDVNLDLSSTEDVTDTGDTRRHTGVGGLLGPEYVHPLAAAEVAPGKIYLPGHGHAQANKTGSVRSRGRVPDPLEVLPFEGDGTGPNELAVVNTRCVCLFLFFFFLLLAHGCRSSRRHRAIPHSSYYNGPPPLDSAYGSDQIGQIGVHYPREILRIERDYSGGELCQCVCLAWWLSFRSSSLGSIQHFRSSWRAGYASSVC